MSAKGKKPVVPRLRFAEFRDAGEWEGKRLEQVAIFLKGKGIAKSDVIPNGSVPCLRYGELYTDYQESITKVKSFVNLDPGNLVFSRINDVIIPASGETEEDIATASCVLQNDIALGGDINILRSRIDGVFFSYYLNSAKREDIARLAQGISVVHLYPSQLKKLIISIPKKSEQQKIAACLTALDDLISAATGRLDALKQHKQGLMQQLFPTQGETVPKLRFPEFREAGEWKVEKLGTISKIVRGGSPRPIDQYLTNDEDGLNWLKIGDISKDSKYIIQTRERVEKTVLAKTRLMKPGDLIMSNSMSFGRPYILKIETCIHDGWIAITINEDVSFDYLYYFLLSDLSQTYFLNSAAGSGVKNLNIEIVKQLPILFSYTKEQQKIAACLTALDDLISAQTQKIAKLKTHKRGLMQQLFSAVDETHR